MAAQSRGQACGWLCPGHRGGTAAGLSLAGGPLGGCVPQGLACLQPGEGWAASGVESLKLDPRVCTAGEQGWRAWWGGSGTQSRAGLSVGSLTGFGQFETSSVSSSWS